MKSTHQTTSQITQNADSIDSEWALNIKTDNRLASVNLIDKNYFQPSNMDLKKHKQRKSGSKPSQQKKHCLADTGSPLSLIIKVINQK